MQKRYIGVILTTVACVLLFLTYVTLLPSAKSGSTMVPTDPYHNNAANSNTKLKPKDIAIVMAYDDNMSFYVPRSVENKKEYANYHGYKFFVEKIEHSELHASWSKITYMKKVMEQNPQISWFWWIDTDSIIMDPTIPLEQHVLLPEKVVNYKNKDIIISWDCNGINTGSFFLRNRRWTHDFLNTMLEYSKQDSQFYGEQRIMQRLYRQDQTVVDHFSFPILRTFTAAHSHKCDLDRGDWKSLYLYHPGDFLIHFPNCWEGKCNDEYNTFWKQRTLLPGSYLSETNETTQPHNNVTAIH